METRPFVLTVSRYELAGMHRTAVRSRTAYPATSTGTLLGLWVKGPSQIAQACGPQRTLFKHSGRPALWIRRNAFTPRVPAKFKDRRSAVKNVPALPRDRARGQARA